MKCEVSVAVPFCMCITHLSENFRQIMLSDSSCKRQSGITVFTIHCPGKNVGIRLYVWETLRLP